jgi:hypothetical protein
MTKRTLVPVILAMLIVAMLAGGYAIVVYNSGGVDAQSDAPSGFFH